MPKEVMNELQSSKDKNFVNECIREKNYDILSKSFKSSSFTLSQAVDDWIDRV